MACVAMVYVVLDEGPFGHLPLLAARIMPRSVVVTPITPGGHWCRRLNQQRLLWPSFRGVVHPPSDLAIDEIDIDPVAEIAVLIA